MSTIVLDKSLAEKLRQCKEMTVLRDAEGKVIGYFEPPEVHVYEEGEVPELDWAELRRREFIRKAIHGRSAATTQSSAMRHDVVWSTHAYRTLEKIWDEAYDQEAIAYAVDRIQDDLAAEASLKGESRPEGLRVYFVAPLAVVFWANDRSTEVEIIDVWAFRSTV